MVSHAPASTWLASGSAAASLPEQLPEALPSSPAAGSVSEAAAAGLLAGLLAAAPLASTPSAGPDHSPCLLQSSWAWACVTDAGRMHLSSAWVSDPSKPASHTT